MKIGLIIAFVDVENAGYWSYAYNLFKNIMKLDKKNEYYLIDSIKRNLDLNAINYVVYPIPIVRFGRFTWPNFILPFKVKSQSFDIVHTPHQFGSLLKTSYKDIITIHDLTPIRFPNTQIPLTVVHYKYFLPLLLKRSDIVISVSEYSKKEISKYYKIPDSKIKVTYNGIDHDMYKPSRNYNEILNKYNINYQFILYVGTLEPRKNIPTLIKAFYKLRKKGTHHKLLIAGSKGWKYEDIFETVKNLNLEKEVIFTDYIPNEDLPALYNAADLFVYPSFYEGFGLPPLEAMACGTPVITSNTSSLPEVVGDAGIMIDPYDVDGFANAMFEVLTNDGLRDDMSEKGLERANMFSWEKTAKETLKVYEEVS